MKLIVTGAAGFIGSVLCRRAMERKHQVLALDNMSRGLNQVWKLDGLHFKRHDCQGGLEEALPGVFEPAGAVVDAVVHLAAGTGSLDRPMEELRALNVEMTRRVYEDAKTLGAQAFVFPTTSLALAVPDSPYVRSKEEALQWLLQQPRRGVEMGLLPLRFFNVVGAYKGYSEKRLREVHIIPRLVDCYRTKDTFVINGQDYTTVDGTPSRTFVNVLDVVDFILEALEVRLMSGQQHPDIVFQDDGAVWVGTSHTTTVAEVVNVFQQWIGEVRVKLGPRRPYDCGALLCAPHAVSSVSMILRRQPAPAWVGIRDEAWELLGKLPV